MGNEHVLTVPGRYEQIKRIVQFVSDGAGMAGLDENAIFHVELCCDEACTNVIEHAYGGEDQGMIRISYQQQGTQFRITIQDNGRPFNPDLIPAPPLLPQTESSPDEFVQKLKIGGLGIHFMRQLMDEVHFSFDPVGGNTLLLVKQIPGEA